MPQLHFPVLFGKALTPDATHDQLATVAFAAVFLLKIAMLYPSSLPLQQLTSQVSEVAHLLSAECFAERYALTLKLMLSNLRRKAGAVSTMPGTPRPGAATVGTFTGGTHSAGLPQGEANPELSAAELDQGLQSLLLPAMEVEDWPMLDGSDGFAWPNEFSPSNLPTWLQDNVSTARSGICVHLEHDVDAA